MKNVNIDKTLFEITPEILYLSKMCEDSNAIEKDLYFKHNVKRGLRDLDGRGVIAGLTNISDVCASRDENGVRIPIEGNLYYRGYNIKDLVKGFLADGHYGFEEMTYLLLFGNLPTANELSAFTNMLAERRTLPPNFVRDVIMKAPSRDMMNSLSRSILNLYSYDAKADDTSIPNVLRQSLNLISQFPMMMVYGYHAYNYKKGEDLFIYAPKKELSMAENILMMLREDRKYTKLEAQLLDMEMPDDVAEYIAEKLKNNVLPTPLSSAFLFSVCFSFKSLLLVAATGILAEGQGQFTGSCSRVVYIREALGNNNHCNLIAC